MTAKIIITSLVGALAAIVAVRWIYFKILKIAFMKGLVDNPDARKLQKRPIPVVGGLAVYFGLLAGMMVVTVSPQWISPGLPHICLFPVFTAMSILLYVGALDDIVGLSPSSRFVLEIGTILGLVFANGMCIDTFHGMWGIQEFSWWIAVPLTVFAGVGIINAVNMIDGVNGLSSGLCVVSCILFGVAFIKARDIPNAVLAFTMAGSIVPFYVHNVFGLRSRMFIGDAGTMVFGVLITWFVICLLSRENRTPYYMDMTRLNMVAFTLSVMSVPVADTLRVMTARACRGKSPFHPDKTHLHHAFVSVGISHFVTSSAMILLNLLITGIWALSVACGAGMDAQLYIVVAASVFFVWGTYAFLRYHARHHTALMHRLSGYGVKTHLGRTAWWKAVTRWLDSSVDYSGLAEELEAELAGSVGAPGGAHGRDIDRKAILEYLKGKAEVHVDDIAAHSGAEGRHVCAILYEEERAGGIVVVKADPAGVPEIVALRCEA